MSRNGIVLFDGECRMCSGWARFVRARDRHGELDLVPLQSEEGLAMLRSHGLPVDAMNTIVFVAEGRCLTKSDAVLAIFARLSGPWPAVSIVRVVPRIVRDAVYDVVARNRRRIFGKPKCEWTPPARRG